EGEAEIDESPDGASTTAIGVDVSLQQDRVPTDLGPDLFFERLVEKATGQMPVTVYPEVRRRRIEAAASDT
ncbi:hypothetical protein, partial [Moorena sp. SIO4A1]|uniref:hypothetical protein n=1 Tax=Moorena sp. SIO4A1 TaxID=2607835 RepID=UPI0025FCDCC9